MKKITILLTLFLITNCSINSQSFIEVDRVGTFNIDNYSDFYIKINEANLSSEISPIAIERFRDNLKSALMETGLTHSSNSNLVFEINITSKDEVESDNFNNYNSRYYWDRYYRDDIRTVSKYILRVNLRILIQIQLCGLYMVTGERALSGLLKKQMDLFPLLTR